MGVLFTWRESFCARQQGRHEVRSTSVRTDCTQSPRVKEQAEQTLRVSMAFTEKEAMSAQLNISKVSALFQEPPAASDTAQQTVGAVECRTTPQDVVHAPEEMNRTAEPKAFQVSAKRVREGTQKMILGLERGLRTEYSTSAQGGARKK